MIHLTLERKEETGSYGRSWGNYAYTGLGLIPEDWQGAVGHIIYKPGGARLMIAPEECYTFVVTSATGAEKRLPAAYHWNLVYDCASNTWYCHTVASGNEIDISPLQAVSI